MGMLINSWPNESGEYRCLVDFFLCEGFPNPFKEQCQRYYADKGPKLNMTYDYNTLRQIDSKLFIVLRTFIAKSRAEERDKPYRATHDTMERIDREIILKGEKIESNIPDSNL
jgi:hypothetical protein